ncbi:ATP-binding protein [Pseudodesulfovibrio thermohalotolerans]|uniref:AAA family ATPase n=1 Tax=Pseudodesulfovibrio thermohalotolerans TaxID=2880651 RepID=UPI002441E8D9|nr:ATP-binding protein [Pseudodesulfovibrio thermohalotolerans]WFS63965.1 ATP-binding protein [Pseudodesulfovibrio thermohalotolerans]
MIIEFVVDNFRSIKNEQVLSLIAEGEKDNHPENYLTTDQPSDIAILKTAAIYGANASGKTTLLEALLLFRELVLSSMEYKIDEIISYYEPHRLDEQYENKPTKFEIEFLAPDLYEKETNQRYNYSISYNKKFILSEELLIFKSTKPSTLFKRESDSPVKWGEYLKGKKQTIESILLDNQLFLSVAGNTKDHPLNVIYRFFRDCISSFRSVGIIGGMELDSYTRRQLTGEHSDTFAQKLTQLLKAADTGIQGIRVKEVKMDSVEGLKIEGAPAIPDEFLELIKKDLASRPFAVHDKYNGEELIGVQEFDIMKESQGTIQLFDLAGPVIETLQAGSTLIIDEISTSLHPDITKFIISLFHSKKTNPFNAQLIFSTHDIITLTSDIFRRDQIWFTQKDNYGATSLFSLLEFGKNIVRKGTNFGSWYLKGKFGALPFINRNLFIPFEDEEEVSNGEA